MPTAAYLPFLADALKKRWQGVAVLVAVEEGKVALLAAVAPDFTKKIQAGKIIQAIAPLVGGKGGGRPELAQGGGTNPDGIPAALEKAEEILGAAGKPWMPGNKALVAVELRRRSRFFFFFFFFFFLGGPPSAHPFAKGASFNSL